MNQKMSKEDEAKLAAIGRDLRILINKAVNSMHDLNVYMVSIGLTREHRKRILNDIMQKTKEGAQIGAAKLSSLKDKSKGILSGGAQGGHKPG